MYSGVTEGDLGQHCNGSVSDACRLVFRARSAAFVVTIFGFMLYAFELKSFERSVFNLVPGEPFYKSLWSNQGLFWAVIIAMASAVVREYHAFFAFLGADRFHPAVYVPTLNTRVFYQAPIGWEWGVVFAMVIVFIVWCEVWKIVRGPLYRRFLTLPTHNPETIAEGKSKV